MTGFTGLVGCVMRHSCGVPSGRLVRFAFAGCVAALLAGCADSQRLSNPFSNPFASETADRAPTATVPPAHPVRAPAPIQSRPLTAPVASYAAPAAPSPRLAAAPAPAPEATASVHHGLAGWSAEGGTPIVVATGETAEMIGRRYNIPTDALIRTNGFTSAGQIHPGTRLIIPVYNAALAASSGVKVAANAPARVAAPQEKLRFVKGPDAAAVAQPKKAAPKPEKAVAVGKTPVAAAPAKPQNRVAKVEEKPAPVAPLKTAKVEAVPAPQPKKVDPTPTASLPPVETKTADTGANPEFRWPARGRIIQGFKAGNNDGINIAVPEGTAVKAVEGGVVAYAGNELKGYGNLVLIRHPNGFVSAYANNSDVEVKRGEVVKRGQVIAKSGQSGNVASPQLHFELRKGSTPVDPTQYLAGL